MDSRVNLINSVFAGVLLPCHMDEERQYQGELHKYLSKGLKLIHRYQLQVGTEICEQVFSWLSKYSRMTHKMSQHTFIFFLLYICDLHNMLELKKLQRAGFM